jgi:hypothetical protein
MGRRKAAKTRRERTTLETKPFLLLSVEKNVESRGGEDRFNERTFVPTVAVGSSTETVYHATLALNILSTKLGRAVFDNPCLPQHFF